MNQEQEPAIILYLKFPQIGTVKTRLISDLIDKTQAFELQIAMIKDTLLLFTNLNFPFQPVISFYPPTELESFKKLIYSFDDFIPRDFLSKLIFIPQKGEGIGSHFKSTFEQAFKLSNVSCCIILGGDTPHLSSLIINKAVDYLLKNELSSIIGPSQSGGFYIYGITRYIENLDLTFSKENELANLLEINKLNALTTYMLPYIDDIDTPQDANSLFLLIKAVEDLDEKSLTNKIFSKPVYTFRYLQKLFG